MTANELEKRAMEEYLNLSRCLQYLLFDQIDRDEAVDILSIIKIKEYYLKVMGDLGGVRNEILHGFKAMGEFLYKVSRTNQDELHHFMDKHNGYAVALTDLGNKHLAIGENASNDKYPRSQSPLLAESISYVVERKLAINSESLYRTISGFIMGADCYANSIRGEKSIFLLNRPPLVHGISDPPSEASEELYRSEEDRFDPKDFEF